MKKIVFILFLGCTFLIKAQNENLNAYKYIIVQEKFNFLKKPDQYQTSSLTKFLLKKSGFTVFLNTDVLPADLNRDRCLGMFASVIDDSSTFTTKSIIVLKDCFGNVLYTSKKGSSKLKEFKKSYHESIRNAYSTMEDIKYVYQPKKEVVNTSAKVVTIEKFDKSIVNDKKPEVVLIDTISAKVDSIKETLKLKVLYAQEKENGYQLVNTKPEVVFMLLKTNVKDVFIVKNTNGILYKKNEIWILESYKEGVLITEKYQIKF